MNNTSKILVESEIIMLSIVIIDKGLINNNLINNDLIFDVNLKSTDNIAILNITHSDSYMQNLKNRFDSMYELLGAKLIFTLCIWKNNIKKTNYSTGNINRFINLNQIQNLRVNIMIDNIKQNIPKYNYIMNYQVIDNLTKVLDKMGLEQIFLSDWTNCFKFNNFDKLTKYIKKKYLIDNLIIISNIKNGLNINQIQYYRQYGIKQQNNTLFNRKRKIKDLEEIKDDNANIFKENNFEFDNFELNLDLF